MSYPGLTAECRDASGGSQRPRVECMSVRARRSLLRRPGVRLRITDARLGWGACAVAVLLGGLVGIAGAGDYYVDAVYGSDTNSGLSPDAAWRSLDRVNAELLSPGSNVLFRSGQTWRGQLSPAVSGDRNAPITFSAWGDGAQPILTGYAETGGWTEVSTNVWETSFTQARPYTVVMDRQFGRDANFGLSSYDPSLLAQPLDWAYDRSRQVLGVYSDVNPSQAYSVHGVEAAATPLGAVYLDNKESIVLDGLDIVGGDTMSYHYGGVSIHGGRYNTIRNSTVRLATGNGINFRDGARDTVIENTVVRENGNDGVYYFGAGRTHELRDSHIENNGLGPTGDRQGVGVWETAGVQVHDNTIIHSREGSWAIEFGSATPGRKCSNSAIYRNVVDHSRSNWNSILLAAGEYEMHNNLIVGNPVGDLVRLAQTNEIPVVANVYNNTLSGGSYQIIIFTVGGTEALPESWVTIKNNILVDPTMRHVDKKSSFDNVTIDYNLYDDPAETWYEFFYDGAYLRFDGWQAASGQDLNSISTNDPLFVDSADSWEEVERYLLRPGSPALDAGIELDASYADRLLGLDQSGITWDLGSLPLAIGGDADLDGNVGLSDYNILRRYWGTGGTWSEGDFSGDGQVGLADWNILRNNWGQSSQTLSEGVLFVTVPEPATLTLLALGGLVLVRRRTG